MKGREINAIARNKLIFYAIALAYCIIKTVSVDMPVKNSFNVIFFQNISDFSNLGIGINGRIMKEN